MFIPPWIKSIFRTVYFAVLILLCLFSSTIAQQFRFDHWTVDEGLPQNSVYSITQTLDGYLWMTTFDGLVRFDGVKFTVFNKGNVKGLPSNRFYRILAEDDGTIWASTEEDGIVRLKDGKVEVFNEIDGIQLKKAPEIHKDIDGGVLMISPDGILRWKDGKLEQGKRFDTRFYKVYFSPNGFRWELDANGLKRTARDGSVINISLSSEINENVQKIISKSLSFQNSIQLFEDREQAIWISFPENLYRIKDGEINSLTKENGLLPSQIVNIGQDAEGNIWLTTIGEGACLLKDNRFNCYDKSKGLSDNNTNSLLTDREGTLWITTFGSGINRVTKQLVTTISTKEGLTDKNIYPLFQDSQGNIWIGAAASLFQITDGKIQKKSFGSQLRYNFNQAIEEDREGRLWFGGIGGVYVVQNNKTEDFIEKLGFKKGTVDFLDIHEDRNGTMWFAGDQGLIKFKDDKATRFTTENGLPSDDVKIIFERKDGTFAIGTKNGLVLMQNNDDENSISILQTYNETNGLAGNHIRSIYEDADGILWIGTYDSGLSRLKDGKFTNFNTSNGMFSNGVFAILEDDRGFFWMSSNQGIYRVSKQELNDFADGKISKITSTAYGKSDGMLNAECNGGRQPSALKNKDGKLWFPTQDGVAIIDPEAVPFNPNPPPVVIESAVLGGTNIALKDKLEIQPNQDNLEIRYTGLSFIKPEQTRFRYKLEGLDENWTEAGTRREAFYPYLPPGTYTFRVIAANSDNVWNEQGAILKITVYPAFYRTWWFIALSVLAIVGFVYWMYHRRLATAHRRQLAQEEFSRRLINAHEIERRRIAAELHDSLGQHLAMIRNSAVFAAQTSQKLEEAQTHLNKISEESVQAITEIREISYNLRPYLLDRLGLTKAINSMLKKVSETTEIEVISKVEKIDGIFPNEAEISIYRIIQESLNNILKHSEATQINFSVEKNNQNVIIKITDNGKGFDVNLQNHKQSGFGLLGMQERVKMLGGTITFESELSKGTTITIKLEGEKGRKGDGEILR